MNFRKLITYLTMGTAAAMPLAVAQNPTILQGNYITNVFGNSNFVLNPNALTNVANVTNATRSTTTPLVATSEFTLSLASGANATWTLRAFDGGMKGQNCEARFTYRGFATATTKAEIVQNSLVVASLTLTPTTDPRIASINFPCGDLVNATTFRIAQTTANMTGTNEIGGIYVGLATNMANVAQAEVVVRATIGTNQSIPNNAYTKVAFDNETLDVYGEFNTTTNTYTAKRAGQYFITATFLFNSTSWAPNANILATIVKNGAETMQNWYPVQGSYTNFTGVTVNQTIDLAVGDTIWIGVNQNSGGAKTLFASTTYSGMSISRFPSSSELVVTPERQNVFGGVVYTAESQSLFAGSAEPTVYSSYNNSTWNKPAKLVGKAAVTTTNSGNDLGFSIPNLPVGAYKLQITGLLNSEPTNITGVIASCNFKIVETTTSTDVAKQAYDAVYTASGGTRNFINSFQGIFNNTSVATRNFRIEAKKFADSDASNNSGCQAYSNTSATGIESNIAFTIVPLDQPSNSALYVEGPVKASATGAAIPAGYAGYVQEATRGSDVNLSTTAGSFSDITGLSISLDPGVWEIESFGPIYITGAAGTGTNGRVGVWQITDNSGAVQRENRCGFVNSVQGTTFMNCFVKTRLLVTSTTIYKARAASIENSAATTNPSFVQVNATGTALAVLRAVRIN